ncbi:hypothetical protein Spb1_02180 [Planctopirus ephydatiae]|uniref:Uncharacterized protein n=1 Tax=Planctopirus ephydatiae TaxID=2528019 RepID=A0A518GID6_9PLAN|nr:hypothetical protein Spb1_02180 [Planctopirus ephydatiae]
MFSVHDRLGTQNSSLSPGSVPADRLTLHFQTLILNGGLLLFTQLDVTFINCKSFRHLGIRLEPLLQLLLDLAQAAGNMTSRVARRPPQLLNCPTAVLP